MRRAIMKVSYVCSARQHMSTVRAMIERSLLARPSAPYGKVPLRRPRKQAVAAWIDYYAPSMAPRSPPHAVLARAAAADRRLDRLLVLSPTRRAARSSPSCAACSATTAPPPRMPLQTNSRPKAWSRTGSCCDVLLVAARCSASSGALDVSSGHRRGGLGLWDLSRPRLLSFGMSSASLPAVVSLLPAPPRSPRQPTRRRSEAGLRRRGARPRHQLRRRHRPSSPSLQDPARLRIVCATSGSAGGLRHCCSRWQVAIGVYLGPAASSGSLRRLADRPLSGCTLAQIFCSAQSSEAPVRTSRPRTHRAGRRGAVLADRDRQLPRRSRDSIARRAALLGRA